MASSWPFQSHELVATSQEQCPADFTLLGCPHSIQQYCRSYEKAGVVSFLELFLTLISLKIV